MNVVIQRLAAALLLLGLVGLLGFVTGCETSGPVDSLIKEIGIDFSGNYRAEDGSSPIVSGNSGSTIRFFSVRQSGNLVNFSDNNGTVYSGQISTPLSVEASNPSAQFVVEGTNTAGVPVAIQGTFRRGGNTNIMDGQWLETNGNKGVVRAFAEATGTTTAATTTRATTSSATTSVFP